MQPLRNSHGEKVELGQMAGWRVPLVVDKMGLQHFPDVPPCNSPNTRREAERRGMVAFYHQEAAPTRRPIRTFENPCGCCR